MTYQRGETAVLQAYVKDSSGDYVDPTGSITITITDPSGSVVVNAQTMSKSETGKYYYDYNIPEDAVIGRYAYQVEVKDGSPVRTTIEQSSFLVG